MVNFVCAARDKTIAVILAGGLARRMGGGDKARLVVGAHSILARTIACVTPHVRAVVLNANGDGARFADLALPVLPDSVPDHPGPLAGILAGLDWGAQAGADWVISAPGDCPFLPTDLVPRLHAARAAAGATFACAASGGWTHPVIGLWPTALRAELRAALLAGQRKIDAYTARHPITTAEWPAIPVDPFFNVNTPEDLAEANRLAG